MTDHRLDYHAEQFLAALTYPLTSASRAVVCLTLVVATYVVLVLSSFPEYSIQMLGAGLEYADDAVVALTANTYTTIGPVGLGLILAYALLTGIAITNALGRARRLGVSETSGLSSAVPGLLASGCASCGAGLLGVLGFAGALATLPFHGNLLRLAGLLFLLGYLTRAGDPRYCTVTPTDGEAD
jgi:hypothetical protein